MKLNERLATEREKQRKIRRQGYVTVFLPGAHAPICGLNAPIGALLCQQYIIEKIKVTCNGDF